VQLIGLITLLSLAPSALMMVTSFTRIVGGAFAAAHGDRHFRRRRPTAVMVEPRRCFSPAS
jgi:hypothetical protein